MECNTVEAQHNIIIANKSNLQSSIDELQNLISKLTETIKITDKNYKCYEGYSILTAEADELNQKLISYENILSSESLKDHQLSTLQEDLQNTSAEIDSLNEKFQRQEFPTEVNSTESNTAIESFMRPMREKIQSLQMKLRQSKNKNRILKTQLENKCKEAISEYQNITLWIERVTIDMQNHQLPNFKDFSQVQLRKRNDYQSTVEKCKNEIENYHSECNIKKENIQMKEMISKTKKSFRTNY